jgi:hypothetical protein
MVNPTLRVSVPSSNLSLPPQGHQQSYTLVANRPAGLNHHVFLALVATITPLLVLMNCLNDIRGTFVAVPMQAAFAFAQPSYSGLDYLGIYAKVLWAYAPPGQLAQLVRCQPIDMP